MSRRPKKYHYIYKTTCKVTGKFYVGMHSTDNLDDGYLGSGKILGYSRHKYGDENHVKEIVEFLPSRDALKLREKEIVNEELLSDPLNINLKYGGDGGWDTQNASGTNLYGKNGTSGYGGENLSAGRTTEAGKKKWARHREKYMQVVRNAQPLATVAAASERAVSNRKKTFSERGHQQGTKNSRFGKRNACVHKNGTNKRVPLDELQCYLTSGWSRGISTSEPSRSKD